MKLKHLIVAAAFAGVTTQPVSAATYLFTISGDSTGSGTFTTNDTANAQGGYLITAIAGLYGGDQIGPLVQINGFAGNDNLLFPGSSTVLSFNGVSFVFANANNGRVAENLYSTGPGTYRDNYGSINIALSAVSAVPEPAVWAMMIAGFGLVGYAMRRRKVGYRAAGCEPFVAASAAG